MLLLISVFLAVHGSRRMRTTFIPAQELVFKLPEIGIRWEFVTCSKYTAARTEIEKRPSISPIAGK